MILDYHLDDGACGLDVADYLHTLSGTPIPAIVTTADHSPEIELRAAEIGAELGLSLATVKRHLQRAGARCFFALR